MAGTKISELERAVRQAAYVCSVTNNDQTRDNYDKLDAELQKAILEQTKPLSIEGE